MDNIKKLKTILILIIGCALGFLNAIFDIYARRIIPLEQWNLYVKDIKTLTEFLKTYNLLLSGQYVEIAIFIIIIAIILGIGYCAKSRISFLLILLALWKSSKLLFMFFAIGWPSSFQALDVVFLYPSPTISPVYITIILSLLLLIISFALLMVNQEEAPAAKKARKKKKK